MSATSLSAGIGKPAKWGSPLGLHPPGTRVSRGSPLRVPFASPPVPPCHGRSPVGQVSPVACTHVLAQRSVVDSVRATSAHTDLAGTPHAAPLARIFVREHLRNHVPAVVLETATLLTTELVTNVVLHARTSIHLGLTWDEHNLLVTVQDGNEETPGDRRHQLDGDHLPETGRGLMVVKSLADEFGWSRLADTTGKVMWFALAIPGVPEQGR